MRLFPSSIIYEEYDKLDSDEELLFLDNVDMVCFLKLLSGNSMLDSMLGSITIGIFLLYIL